MRDPALIAVYHFEFYVPRAETWPVIRTYPRIPITYETFLLFWR